MDPATLDTVWTRMYLSLVRLRNYLCAVWTSDLTGQDLSVFVATDPFTLILDGYSAEGATQLLTFGQYLVAASAFPALVQQAATYAVYTQWANGTYLPTGIPLPGGGTGFEAGIPTPTSILSSRRFFISPLIHTRYRSCNLQNVI